MDSRRRESAVTRAIVGWRELRWNDPPSRLSLALGTTYSQIWFPLSERTTATMLLTVRPSESFRSSLG
jgi:hypothetical protein